MLDAYAQYAPDTVLSRALKNPALRREMQDAIPQLKALTQRLKSGTVQARDAAVSGGMAFLEAELEKRDPKVYEPLTSVTFARDVEVESGGGWVDFTSNYFVDYAMSGPNFYGLSGGQSTTIPIIQANLQKDVWPVFPWQNVMKVNFIDMQKAQGIGRSLDQMYDNGIKINWNKMLDLVTYQGPFAGNTGLLNNTTVPATSAALGASGLRTWVNKTPDEILLDINTVLVSTWAASQYDVTGMADSLLIPPSQFALLSRINSAAGDSSIMNYILKNNIAITQGRNLTIFPSRWCIAAGAGSTDRMFAYVNNKDRVLLNVPVPIQRVMTTPNISDAGGAYLTLYAAMVGVIKFLYYTPAAYVDGI